MSSETASAKPIVLIVDDAPEYLSMLSTMLISAYTVRLASSGPRALQLAQRKPRPDLVVLDVLMPDMDGHAVLAALRADPCTSDIPVIFMTSLRATSDELAGLSQGAADYIVKPAPPEVVQARVRTQIQLKQMRDALRQQNEALQAEIAHRRQMEQALRQTVDDLEAFSHSVSHDLRAPLATIGGFAAALHASEGSTLSPKSLSRLERIVAGSEKMGKMIDEVLIYSRSNLGPIRQQRVATNTLASEVVDAAIQAYPGVQMSVGPLPEVWADAAMLRQILANLLGNALKFSSKRPDPRIEIGARPHQGATELFVRDNGAGFDAAYADKLFGLFKRLHSETEFPGTGLGLAIVKRLVGRHRGEVRAESVPGGWTTFTVSLPDAPEHRAAAAQPDSDLDAEDAALPH